jgi:hypothetical protein
VKRAVTAYSATKEFPTSVDVFLVHQGNVTALHLESIKKSLNNTELAGTMD